MIANQLNNHRNSHKKYKFSIEDISLLGVVARGQTPWKKREFHKDYCKLSEIEYAYNLSRAEIYLFSDGSMKGKPDYQRIAEELNKVYHNGKKTRDRYKVRNALYKYRKKLETRI